MSETAIYVHYFILNQLEIIFPPPPSTQMHPPPQSLSPLLSSPSLILQNLKQLISNGSFQQALSLFNHLHSSNLHFQISPSILPSLLKASSSSSNLPFTLQLHSLLLKSNLIIHPPTLNSLLCTYSKHFDAVAARKLFDEMPLIRDPITWSSMINSYSQNGYFLESLKIFKEMSSVGLEPKPELVATVVSACSWTGSLSLGRAIHARVVIGSFFDECVLLGTSLIDMYMKFGDLDSGLRVFGLMFGRNVVSWTAVINGCFSCGNYNLAIDHLRRMRMEGVEPNRATMVSALQPCGELGALKLGKEIHGCVFKHGFELDSKVTASLINMYSKCAGGIKQAYLIFERAKERDTITWSSMLTATSMIGDYIKTFELFGWMKRDGVEPNSITMLAIVDACIGLASLDHGLSVLSYSVKSGLISDVNLGNSLINMFAKCGCLESSSRVFFELMPTKDSISYGSMIQSFGFHGCGVESLRLFEEMQELGFKCDDITILAVLSACNHSGLIGEGKKFFDSVKRDNNVGLRVEHYACYVDLLGRGGRIEEACEVVRKMPMKPSLRILSSLISACRVHGRFEIAEELSRELIDLEPKNAASYALVSMVYADEQNWDGVKEIRRAMRERGLRKNLGCSRI